jgi:hypothetical protein
LAAGAQEAAAFGDLSTVEQPPDLGETDLRVYVDATGHTLSGVMLEYWRATGGLFGDPISEPFAAANGYYSQAFERGVLQYRPEFLFTVEPIVRPMPLGRMSLAATTGSVRADGKRAGGGGDPLASVWLPQDPGEGVFDAGTPWAARFGTGTSGTRGTSTSAPRSARRCASGVGSSSGSRAGN